MTNNLHLIEGIKYQYINKRGV